MFRKPIDINVTPQYNVIFRESCVCLFYASILCKKKSSSTTLKALRGKLGIDSLATQLTTEVSRQQERRNNGNADDADNNGGSNASTLSPSRGDPRRRESRPCTDLLLGHRLATPNTGITAATSTPPPLTLLSLRNWQPVKGNGIHTNLQTTVDDALANCNADTERRQTKIQKEHSLFEASVVTLAQYFQEGIHVRNKLFWKQKQATS